MSEKTKSKKTRYIFLILRIAVIAVGIGCGIVWASRGQRAEQLADIFRQMNLGIFAIALVIFVACQIIVSFRWWLLLRVNAIIIGFWAAVRLHYLGLFYNNFMPSSIGGDLIRAWYVTTHTDKKYEAALSVFVDRIIGLASTLVIAVSFYVLRDRTVKITTDEKQTSTLESLAQYKHVLLWAIAAAAVILCLLLLVAPTRRILKKIWANFLIHGKKFSIKLKDSIKVYFSKPLAILIVFALTVFLQVFVITGFWLLGTNIGVDVSIKYYYMFFTLTWVIGAIPISIGGAVIVEGLLAILFVQVGANPEAAAVLALCQRAVWMITSLPGAAIHLFGAHLPAKDDQFFVDSNDHLN